MIAGIKRGESQANVSRDNGVPGSTIRGWLRKEWKLRDFVDTVNSTDRMKGKKARTAKDPQHDKAVFTRFAKETQAGRHPD